MNFFFNLKIAGYSYLASSSA